MSINLAVIRGHITAPPEQRLLPSGRELAVMQVTTRPAEGAISVPVIVWDPPKWLGALDAGAEVFAIGVVRRRFFRAGATTASRVEVEASFVCRTNDKRRMEVGLRRITTALEPLNGEVEA